MATGSEASTAAAASGGRALGMRHSTLAHGRGSPGALDGLVFALVAVGFLRGTPVTAALYVVVGAAAAVLADRPSITPQLAPAIPRLAVVALVPSALVGALAVTDPDTSRQLLQLAIVAFVVLVAFRAAVLVHHRRRPSTAGCEHALIVGSGDVAAALVETLADPRYGLCVIGAVDHEPTCTDLGVPYLGDATELPELIRQHDVRHVIIAFGHVREVDLVDLVRSCTAAGVQVRAVPRLFELGTLVDADDVRGIPLVPVGCRAAQCATWRTKRMFDLLVTAVCLPLVLPVMGVIALLVRCSSPGPILFRQERLGQHGRPFQLLKFRTMQVNDDDAVTWSVHDDDRITKVGGFLRRTSLDELPQLLNVLAGAMSLVGPRPERPHFAAQFTGSVPRYEHRLRVPVGMTGLAQVNGLRGDTSITERVWFDNVYIENWSLWTDIVILARTVTSVLKAQGNPDSRPDDVFRVAAAGLIPVPAVAAVATVAGASQDLDGSIPDGAGSVHLSPVVS